MSKFYVLNTLRKDLTEVGVISSQKLTTKINGNPFHYLFVWFYLMVLWTGIEINSRIDMICTDKLVFINVRRM
ncbi:hypothetical protein Patl1_21492 [Pistacia atlantica]|uniref:Uncharacterized protein n=1 Tax=Pistacia atlantica TaxID=434234 RepID=A0ACC1BMX5_9ROSI|nr:hypothetical protein Patl1_21492 [Pistacia atlantica]